MHLLKLSKKNLNKKKCVKKFNVKNNFNIVIN